MSKHGAMCLLHKGDFSGKQHATVKHPCVQVCATVKALRHEHNFSQINLFVIFLLSCIDISFKFCKKSMVHEMSLRQKEAYASPQDKAWAKHL